MKKPLFMRNRRGVARRGVGFSLFIVIVMSTLLGFAAQIAIPQTVQAASPNITKAKSIEMRTYLYFADCLRNKVDWDGKARDGNKRNIEFENYKEVWKDSKAKIVVGLDHDDDGVRSCITIAKKAMAYYKPDVASYEAYIERKLWGKTIDENGGPIKVGSGSGKVDPEDVKANARAWANEMDDLGNAIKNSHHLKKYTLDRLALLLNRCYKDWSDKLTDTKKYSDDEDINSPGRDLYANSRDFEAKEVPYIKVNDGSLSLTNSEIGDIELGFLPSMVNNEFNARNSDWYPIGNDLGESFLGSAYYKKHSNQTFLDCEWINKKSDYLFKRSSANRFYFRPENGKAVVRENTDTSGSNTEDNDGEDEIATEDETGITDDTTASGGSNNYQCVVTPPLSWIACPVITLMVNALEVLEGAIVDALQVPALTSDGDFESLHDTWAAFRDVANAFLVLIFLITIFAQVLPLDLDPYMVKKVLPKLIAAAILIQFSYFIVQILFDISRVLGYGARSILENIPVPESGGGIFGEEVGQVTATSTFASIGAVAVGGAGVAAAFAAGSALVVPVLLLLLSALISVITLFVTLQIRMIVIIILTIVAPLAFLAWILPNTENYFKKWGTSLIKLLLMYPIIVLMVESANIISKVSYAAVTAMASTDEGVTEVSKLMISIIPIIIYFMIPMTFKWAGGIFASMSDAVQNQGGKLSRRARTGALMKNSLGDLRNKAALKLPDPGKDKLGLKGMLSGRGFSRLGARTASGNALSFGEAGARKINAAKEAAEHAQNAGVQAIHRGKSNDTLLQILKQLKNSGKMGEAVAVADLIAKQGGGLELSKYFKSLEFDESGDRLADADTRVNRKRNGSVEEIHDEIWNSLQKNHSSMLAQEIPSSIGKPMSAASPNAHISAKGAAPAIQFKREVAQLEADLSSTEVDEEGNSVAANAQKKLNELAATFTQVVQRDNAGDMQGHMVAAWKDVGKVLGRTTTVKMKTAAGDIPIEDFIKTSTENGKLHKYVQGT